MSGMITQSGGAPQQSDPAGNPMAQNFAQQGAKADAIRKLVQSYAPEAKDLHSGLKAMSLPQLEGMLKGYTLKATAEEHAARMEDYQAQAKLRDQEATSEAAVGPALLAYTQAQGKDGAEPSAQERWAAAAKTPGFGGRVVPKFIAALAKYNEATGDAGPPVVTPGPYPGISFAQSKSGRGGLHVVTDPAAGVGVVQDPITGDVVPNMIMTRTGPRAIPQPKEAEPALVAKRTMEANKMFVDMVNKAQADLGFAQTAMDSLKPNDPKRAKAEKYLESMRANLDRVMATNPHAAPTKTESTKQSGPNVQTMIDKANDAIKRGADPAKVKAWLAKQGVSLN